ncbi:MAG: DEAD/DEAH box helicase [Ignavibacteriales bacterium]|nr:DEAD/DEAH box helicase [Ignavibacteriales bacterium]MCF8437497.1 DEAD/DEAH box helicase [Ignavibacteriales bacterium]
MKTFEELGIETDILRAISELGFVEPMPVQAETIPHLLKEKSPDLMALAQTGTGKTAAFGIPLIQKTDLKKKKIQHVILSPTRELCLQISDDLSEYAKYLPKIKIAAVFGGASIDRQIEKIKGGVQIISATPGRLLDLIKRGIVDLSHIQTVVLDEADEMLNMGFKDELDAILETTPDTKNTLLFSASMPDGIIAIARKHMTDPIEITIGKRNAGAENVDHVSYMVHARDRYLALKRIVDFYPQIYGIVFCRTRQETQEVSDMLIKDGYNADALHGDLSQVQRNHVMNKFRIKHLQLLVATDVAARGLDVENLSHIINYNIPEELEVYTHRSGRTGRAGRKGTSIVIANMKEKGKIHQIEKMIGKTFSFEKVPEGIEICKRQLIHLIDRVEKVEVDYTQIDPLLPDIFRKLEWLDREELIKKFVSVEFNRFLAYYKGLVDLESPLERAGSKRSGASSGEFTRMFINLGSMDDVKPGTLMELIAKYTGKKDIEIGAIDIMTKFSFIEVDPNFAEIIIKSMAGKSFKKRRLDIEVALPKSPGERREGGFRSERKKSGFRDRPAKKGFRKGNDRDRGFSSDSGNRKRKKPGR